MRIPFALYLISCCINLSFAATLNIPRNHFEIKKANREFDKINLALSVQNLNQANLLTAVDRLDSLIEQSNLCIDNEQKKLNNINQLIKQNNTPSDAKKEGVDLVYLDNQKKQISDIQAQCRLFSIRAKEAVEAYKTAIAQFEEAEVFSKDTPIGLLVNQSLHTHYNPVFLTDIKATWLNALPNTPYYLMVILLASAAAALLLAVIRNSKVIRHHLRLKKNALPQFIFLNLLLLSSGWYLFLVLQPTISSNGSLIQPLAMILLCFSITLLGISMGFKINKIRAFFYWYALDISFFQYFLYLVSCIYSLLAMGRLLTTSYNLTSPIWQLCQSFFTFMIINAGTYTIFYFCRTHRHFSFIQHHVKFIRRSSIILAITCILLSALGYKTLTNYLITAGFTSCIIVFITLLITQGINRIYLALYNRQSVKSWLIKYLGYRNDQPFIELLILKTLAQLILLATSAYLIAQNWPFIAIYVENIFSPLINGFNLGNMVIYPPRVISGVVVYCLLYLFFRSLSSALTRQQQFENEEETQVAIASILNYSGFALAVISGLLVSGFNFTGLAIVAGALSVGIGLGLQSIVNNFVCGIILLIEKPIKAGDRISVDGIEGFVKKIRARSTQIITPGREDIIIPNADLISRRVTNFMLSDKFCHINCILNLAYGSDTNLARELLLNIANNHEEIIKTGRNKPVVLFNSFSDNALVFHLSCLLRDVNKKSWVQSDLNFAIDQAFRLHGIQLAHPQRDVHIKLSELNSLTKKMNESAAVLSTEPA